MRPGIVWAGCVVVLVLVALRTPHSGTNAEKCHGWHIYDEEPFAGKGDGPLDCLGHYPPWTMRLHRIELSAFVILTILACGALNDLRDRAVREIVIWMIVLVVASHWLPTRPIRNVTVDRVVENCGRGCDYPWGSEDFKPVAQPPWKTWSRDMEQR